MHVTAPPGDNLRLFILDLHGQVQVYDRTTNMLAATPYLNLTDYPALTSQDGGAFALAFDPNFAANKKIYVSFADGAGNLRVVSFTENGADPSMVSGSPTNVLTVPKPIGSPGLPGDHFAGWIGFSPNDGLLYVTTGDGNVEPINGISQDYSTKSGAILRIDPSSDDFPADADNNYAVPAGNPHVGEAGVDEAIYAKGLRNAFRASFDPNTGTLYVSDVGENLREEINIGAAGANYGWPGFEGSLEFDLTLAPGINAGDITFPVHEYGDPVLRNSVTGGEVYRGPIGELDGLYFFADYLTGEVWSFRYDETAGNALDLMAWDLDLGGALLDHPVSFGVDSNGNLYLIDLVFGNGSDIFMVTGVGGYSAVPLPATLPLLAASLTIIGLLASRRRRSPA